MAQFFLAGVMLLSAGAAAGLYMTKTNTLLLKKSNVYLLVGAALLCVLAYKTATSGGEIRHPELIKGAQAKTIIP